MTLRQSLHQVGGAVLTTAQFNSYTPNDGEVVAVLVTGAWASGDAVWHFRYRRVNPDGQPNGNQFKWDFLGGPPLYDHIDAGDTATFGLGHWIDFSSGAGTPQFNPFPIHGQFIVRFGAAIASSADGTLCQIGVSVNGADPANANTTRNNNTRIAGVAHSSVMNFAIGDNVKMEYQCDSGTASFQLRWMEISPTRVSSG